jgi:protein TonB
MEMPLTDMTSETQITSDAVPWHGRALEWLRSKLGERTGGVLFALLVEILFILALLSLSIAPPQSRQDDQSLTVFGVSPEPTEEPVEEENPAPSQDAPQSPEPQDTQTPPVETPSPVVSTVPSPVPPAIVPMPSAQPAKPQASPQKAQPKANPGRVYGPVDKGTPGDTERVGSAPNGEPLYAAAWYREPYDDELSGYLSTARGPGSALIACRTVPDFRVEDCVQMAESPPGSGIGRAVIAAAWQFRVRPPRVGGTSKVGEWVRIRIDYSTRRQ